jgi:hypothetical protein
VWKNGNKYEGELEDFSPDGMGKLEKADGSVYEGEFLSGKMHG